MTDRSPARPHANGQMVGDAYLHALGAMDEEALLAAFSAEATVYLPAGSPAVRGRPEIRELVRTIFAAVEPLEVRQDLVVAEGDSVAVVWTGRFCAFGGEVTFGGIDIFALDPEGRITTWWGYWDRSAFVPAVESDGVTPTHALRRQGRLGER